MDTSLYRRNIVCISYVILYFLKAWLTKMKFTTTAWSYSFNYAKLLQENLHSQYKDMCTTHPDSQKLIHARKMKYQMKIPEQSDKLDRYFKIFLLTLHFTNLVNTFLGNLLPY